MWKWCLVFAGVLSSAALVLADLPRPPSSPRARPKKGAAHAPAGTLLSSADVGRMPAVGAAAVTLDPANPWPAFETPAAGPGRAIGAYSHGCLQGGVALPLDGDGYQVMRPASRRYFGHPALVNFIEKLGRQVRERDLGVVLIGDLSHARGGRATGGHSSHQTGLDVDIWFWRPEQAVAAPLARELRDTLEAPSILDAGGVAIREPWKRHVAALLRITAEDPGVDRIFVHPSIKRELCAAPAAERAWLRKLRPWHGHDEHFHVRLACPSTDPACRAQRPLPSGDGCERLGWWFSERSQGARHEALLDYAGHVREGRGWPLACSKLL